MLFLAFAAGCETEAAVLIAMGAGTGIGAWFWGRDRQQRALYEAEHLRLAITSGDHRELEYTLRRQLALAAAGHGVSIDRQWAARLELGALLTAEWRLDEARELYLPEKQGLSRELQHAVELRIFELNALSHTPDEATLAAISTQRELVLQSVALRWRALEGLCLARMGRSREATVALEQGMSALAGDPVRVAYTFYLAQAYEAIGDRQLASDYYQRCERAFPGTRLASEATSRQHALGGGAQAGPFRELLPATPANQDRASATGRPDDHAPTKPQASSVKDETSHE